MNGLKRILSAGVLLCIFSAGGLALDQKKDDSKVPDKNKTVTVPVTPKNDNSKSGNGNRHP